MKIIAKTNNGYMLEASKEEIALMLGFRNSYDSGISSWAFDIGSEMHLAKMARTSEFIRTMDKDKLESLKTQLTRVLDALNETSETINALTVFEILKDEHGEQ